MAFPFKYFAKLIHDNLLNFLLIENQFVILVLQGSDVAGSLDLSVWILHGYDD